MSGTPLCAANDPPHARTAAATKALKVRDMGFSY
jgi:hypothetical protein